MVDGSALGREVDLKDGVDVVGTNVGWFDGDWLLVIEGISLDDWDGNNEGAEDDTIEGKTIDGALLCDWLGVILCDWLGVILGSWLGISLGDWV